MKIKISNVLIEMQERLLGYVSEMSYGYAQLCVKADPSSLLGFEERIDEKKYRMEDMARVFIHDQKDDDDKIDLYPIDPAFITVLITGMFKIHPEFKISVEKIDEIEGVEDDDSPQLKFIRLTMPTVTKEYRKTLLTAIDALDYKCKGRHEQMKVKYTSELMKVCVGEKPETIDEAKDVMEGLMKQYDDIRVKLTTQKKEEVENAFQRYLREKAKEDGVNRDADGNPIGSTLKMEE